MTTPSVAVIDALNSLLEAEANSIFHFVGEGSPYVKDAGPEVKQMLIEMSRRLDRHSRELEQLIRRLGGEPAHPPTPQAEEQYLSFLSLPFLLPKLVEAKNLMIQRYHSALKVVAAIEPAKELLSRQLQEINAGLEDLNQIAANVALHGDPS